MCPVCQQVRFWPEYGAETLIVPIVDLDKPSCAFRGAQATAADQPYLDMNDFLKLPCGHPVDPNALTRCLSK